MPCVNSGAGSCGHGCDVAWGPIWKELDWEEAQQEGPGRRSTQRPLPGAYIMVQNGLESSELSIGSLGSFSKLYDYFI